MELEKLNKNLKSYSCSTLYAHEFGLKPGDRIKEPIFKTGISKHHSIYLGVDQNGHEWISENKRNEGVRLIKACEYFKYGKSYTIIPFKGTYMQRTAAVKRALAVLGKPYDLILYNCEHYANYVQLGKPVSQQVLNTIIFTLTVIVIGNIFSNGR